MQLAPAELPPGAVPYWSLKRRIGVATGTEVKGRGTSFVTMTVMLHADINKKNRNIFFKIQGHSRDPHAICDHEKRMPCVKSNDNGAL